MTVQYLAHELGLRSIEVDFAAKPLYTAISPFFVVTPRVSVSDSSGDLTGVSLSESICQLGVGALVSAEITRSVQSICELLNVKSKHPSVRARSYLSQALLFLKTVFQLLVTRGDQQWTTVVYVEVGSVPEVVVIKVRVSCGCMAC